MNGGLYLDLSKDDYSKIFSTLQKIIIDRPTDHIYVLLDIMCNFEFGDRKFVTVLYEFINNYRERNFCSYDINNIYNKYLQLCKNTIDNIINKLNEIEEDNKNSENIKHETYTYLKNVSHRFISDHNHGNDYYNFSFISIVFNYICYDVLMKEYKHIDKHIINNIIFCLLHNTLVYNNAQNNITNGICVIKSLIVFIKKLSRDNTIKDIDTLYDKYYESLNYTLSWYLNTNYRVYENNENPLNENEENILYPILFNNIKRKKFKNYNNGDYHYIMSTELVYNIYLIFVYINIGRDDFDELYHNINTIYKNLCNIIIKIEELYCEDNIIDACKTIKHDISINDIDDDECYSNNCITMIYRKMLKYIENNKITINYYKTAYGALYSLHDFINIFYEFKIEDNYYTHVIKNTFNDLVKNMTNSEIITLINNMFSFEIMNYVYKVNENLPFLINIIDLNGNGHAMCGYYDNGRYHVYDPNNVFNYNYNPINYNILFHSKIDDSYPFDYKAPLLSTNIDLYGGNYEKIFRYTIYLLIIIVIIVLIILIIKNKLINCEYKDNFNYIK